jgi:lipopolysaccharide/colanic/teichoic acid biosynthesis glycosyltransferase
VFIGENSRIGVGASLGPNAVVGHDSIVDRHTQVINSAVLPGSYCGERLELDHVIVDRNRLLSSRLDASVSISDTFILSGLRDRNREHFLRTFLSRSVAAVLLLLTLPLVVLTGLALLLVRRTPLIYRKSVAQIPVSERDAPMQTFGLYSLRDPADPHRFTKLSWLLLDFLPALGQVVMGRLHLIGLRPRTEEEIQKMPEDWRSLYLQGRAGLLTEAFVIHGPTATDDEVYSCEAYYTAVNGFGHDLALAVRFITGEHASI